GWLTRSERARLEGLAAPSRRATFLAGRWLLRQLLAELFGGSPTEHTAEIDVQGRSSACGGSANISHSGDRFAAAWSPEPIGIDIELLRPRRDLLGLAAGVHGPAQCAELALLDDATRLRRFYELWTLKEATLKREGEGLDMARMRGMDFMADRDGDCWSLALEHEDLALAVVGPLRTPGLPPGVTVIDRLRLKA
ncbi:4'-phosphopantetheinyl transferase superfamily protein, partial [Pelomonas sp. KK5]|uniref:4'-phosphopantetheinyl transferase family protein n=1 Tax=Pelomonas sp. KK5 TaxID=1855730 RepID=UPI00097C3E13